MLFGPWCSLFFDELGETLAAWLAVRRFLLNSFKSNSFGNRRLRVIAIPWFLEDWWLPLYFNHTSIHIFLNFCKDYCLLRDPELSLLAWTPFRTRWQQIKMYLIFFINHLLRFFLFFYSYLLKLCVYISTHLLLIFQLVAISKMVCSELVNALIHLFDHFVCDYLSFYSLHFEQLYKSVLLLELAHRFVSVRYH